MVTRVVQSIPELPEHTPESNRKRLQIGRKRSAGSRATFEKYFSRFHERRERLLSRHGRDGFHQFVNYKCILLVR